MANLYANTDPREPDYNPILQAIQHSTAMDSAVAQAKYDEITQFDRYRKYPIGPNTENVAPEARFTYTPKVPPWFAGSLSQQLMGNPDTNILPLDIGRDPNFSYAMYANADQRAKNLDNTWKLIANMPTSPLDDEDMKARRQNALDSLSQRFMATSETADTYKQDAIELQSAYNRQIGIQNLRQWDAAAHDDASQLEQAARDYHRLNKEASSLNIADKYVPDALVAKIAKAETNLKKASFEWDSRLERRGFMGPKGPYLLSGVPGQFLDDIADRGAKDLRLTNEKIKMFQSRYVKDAPFRASVNQGLKAKVPGVLAAGIGGALVKQKMDEGESLPKAVGTTAGDIVLGAAKFALMDRFVGPVGDLNQGENEYLQNRDKVKFVQQLDDAQMAELEKDFPHLKREQAKVAKVLRERMAESKAVEDNITNSPLWNIAK